MFESLEVGTNFPFFLLFFFCLVFGRGTQNPPKMIKGHSLDWWFFEFVSASSVGGGAQGKPKGNPFLLLFGDKAA